MRKGKKKNNYEPIYQWQTRGMMATSWQDKRAVHVLSTQSRRGTVSRDGKVKPRAVHDYNENMNGVEKMDQAISYYPSGRPGSKWWRYVVWHILDVAINNAYIHWRESREGDPDAPAYMDALGVKNSMNSVLCVTLKISNIEEN